MYICLCVSATKCVSVYTVGTYVRMYILSYIQQVHNTQACVCVNTLYVLYTCVFLVKMSVSTAPVCVCVCMCVCVCVCVCVCMCVCKYTCVLLSISHHLMLIRSGQNDIHYPIQHNADLSLCVFGLTTTTTAWKLRA